MPLEPYHLHHEGRDPDIGVDDGTGVAVACPFADDAKPDSARVTSSAKRNLSSKATRSWAALSSAAVASSSGVGLEVPYAHEPSTTAAIVNPWVMIRTRSQLFNECDWPFRIFVIAITSATVVAAAPVCKLVNQYTSFDMYSQRWRTDRNEWLLLEFTQCLFTVGFTRDRGMSGHGGIYGYCTP